MSAARKIISSAAANGIQIRVHEGRLQISANHDPPADILQQLSENRKEIIFELSRKCINCGSHDAHFGFGYDFRRPINTRWLCHDCVGLKVIH